MFLKVKIIINAFIFISAFLIPSFLASGLSRTEYDIIKNAFINGYVRALHLDMEKIESFKKDLDAMKKYVIYKADQYMDEVLNLNLDIQEW